MKVKDIFGEGDANARSKLYDLLLNGNHGPIKLVEQHNAVSGANPHPIVVRLIPQRLGAIGYSGSASNSGLFSFGIYSVNAKDPATGAGLDFSGSTDTLLYDAAAQAQIGNPAYLQNLQRYYTGNALARGAIAPGWEVPSNRCYEINSYFYPKLLGCCTKTLLKVASNDGFERVEA